MSKAQWILCAVAVIWITCAIGGLYMIWAYDNQPGAPATPQAEWPGASRLARADDRPTSVLLAQPPWTCTRATLGGLADAVARAKAQREWAGAARTS